ncbi:MAG: hypothetical protein OWU84_13180 [Firmicutes bacterium]|nr:hypothetical protein [Bacillota bacterium]
MNYDQESRVGELLDRALADELGLYFQPAWHPKYAVRHRHRWRRAAIAGATAAVLALMAVPLTVKVPQGHGAVSNPNLAAIRLPRPLSRSLQSVSRGPATVASMVPIYGTYPLATPTGHNLSVTGRFRIGSVVGNAFSLVVNNHMALRGGVLFNSGVPVYEFAGANMRHGTAIRSPKKATPAAGVWGWGGNVSINTFSAAGSHVYVTHGNLWSDMVSDQPSPWMPSPGSTAANTVASIAGLPSQPNEALLLEESPSGLSRGFITLNGGATWSRWPLGTVSMTNLIAIGHRFWAILNGSLVWSRNGFQWHNILPLNTNEWQVETYAVNPANPHMVAVSLIPISGDGIGPVLETRDDGRTWSEVPHFPALGAAPTTMVMTPHGSIAALINASGPVLVQYTPDSQEWSILPVPIDKAASSGVGQLAATANGNYLYGAPGGLIYQWIHTSGQWLVIDPPTHYRVPGLAAFPLEAIGDNQVLAGYPSGWAIFLEPPSEVSGQPPDTSPSPLKAHPTNPGSASDAVHDATQRSASR